MKPIGLLISCATPAASCPIDAIFSAWSTWRWSCLISVRSWKITTAPRRTPSPSTSGAHEVPIGTRSPASARDQALGAAEAHALAQGALDEASRASAPSNQRHRLAPRSASGGAPRMRSARRVRVADGSLEVDHDQRAVHVLDDVLVVAAQVVAPASRAPRSVSPRRARGARALRRRGAARARRRRARHSRRPPCGRCAAPASVRAATRSSKVATSPLASRSAGSAVA